MQAFDVSLTPPPSPPQLFSPLVFLFSLKSQFTKVAVPAELLIFVPKPLLLKEQSERKKNSDQPKQMKYK